MPTEHSLGSLNLSYIPVIQVLRRFRATIFHVIYILTPNREAKFIMQK